MVPGLKIQGLVGAIALVLAAIAVYGLYNVALYIANKVQAGMDFYVQNVTIAVISTFLLALNAAFYSIYKKLKREGR